MDTFGKLIRILKDRKGIAAVYIALILFVLVAFVGFAIDIGYMYVAKGQLQNAADASALAGVSLLDGTALTAQANARQEAQKYAALHKAATEPVQIDLNTSNDANGDIVIGWWNGSDVVPPPTNKPCNAVKVTCRRNTETGIGISTTNKAVDLFFSKVIGWSQMGTKAQAVAYMPPMATSPMALCPNALNLTPPTWFYFKNSDTEGNTAQNVAFTEFGPWTQGQPPQNTNYGPNSLVAQYIREEQTPPDVCGKGIYTQNSGAEQIITVLQNKFTSENGVTNLHGNALDNFMGSWKVIVPVGCIIDPSTGSCATDPCDPSISGQGVNNKFLVTTYVQLDIVQITSNPVPAIKVADIQDLGCNPNPLGLGLKPRLAK
jgi:Flp pilus assembly protein TadG